MNKQAQKRIEEIRSLFLDKEVKGALVADDNEVVIKSLNEKMVNVKDIMNQETWIFSDSSYITRNDDMYWTGNDVYDFLVIEHEAQELLKLED